MSHLFTIASKEWGIFLTNPLSLIRKPKPSKARTRRLEGDEYDRLLLHASSHLKPLIILAVETAMRLGELLSMKWENVDLKKRYVFLPDTKNGDSRIVPLSLLATKTLETYPKHIKEERVFYNWKVSSDAIQCTWRSTLKKAGIEDLRFHDLRHHAISVMVEKGMNPLEVASISGHKTMQMLKRYTHLKVEDLVRKLG